MKSIIFAASAVLLLSSAAYAADAVVDQVPEAPVASSFDWSGAYIGVNAGGGWGHFKSTVSGPAPAVARALSSSSYTLADPHAGGFLGGVQAGYNWQSGQMVYGVETDFQGTSIEGSDKDHGYTIAKTKVDWYGTLRARIGFTPVDRFMVYGTGGLAYGHFKTTAFDGEAEGSKTRAGWTLGAGAEYAITSNWTLKSEYLYVDLGKATMASNDYSQKLKTDVAFHTVRIGLNYKF